MLIIHWSKHKNTGDILKNGIRPKRRKSKIEKENVDIKGVWCYPYTRHKNFNNNWKRNLKTWRQDVANFNGFVFKLEESDFPIYAGNFSLIGCFPKECVYSTYEEFINGYGKYFSPEQMSFELNEKNTEEGWLDYQDFEIIVPNGIDPKRIIKTLKDRTSLPKK